MNKLKTLGQIGLLPLFGIGVSILMGAVGFVIAGFYNTNGKIDKVKMENVETVQRVSKIEEAIITLKEDNREIKQDLKIIIQKIK